MKPLIPLTDPRFKYVSADETDIRATFARVKAAQERARVVRDFHTIRQQKRGRA